MTAARPILFSALMVCALLDGRKTQTRRIVKPQPYSNGFHFDGRDILCHNDFLPPSVMLLDVGRGRNRYTTSDVEGWEESCPYGQPGDLLWCRETWRPVPDSLSECTGPKDIRFAATVSEAEWAISTWRPSIHMPRWASRLTLRLTGVRVERLQEISETDARAEGVSYGNITDPVTGEIDRDAVEAYEQLWEEINGPGSWEANPWVWALTFDVIQTNVDAVLKREAA